MTQLRQGLPACGGAGGDQGFVGQGAAENKAAFPSYSSQDTEVVKKICDTFPPSLGEVRRTSRAMSQR